MRLILFILVIFLSIHSFSQDIQVVSLKQLMSAEAGTQARYDANGEKCALIKVSVPALENVEFKGGYVVSFEPRGPEYWVYVASGAKKIRVLHKNFHPLELEIKNYIDGELASGVTYQLNLSLPKNTSDKTIAHIKTNVKKATIAIAGTSYDTANGEFNIPLKAGQYEYTLSTNMEGFNSKSGNFSISGEDILQEIPQINLESQKVYSLTLRAEDNVSFKVDGNTQAKSGEITVSLPAGIHEVESYLGDGELFYRKQIVDLTTGNMALDMSLSGVLYLNSPKNAEFTITPQNGALVPKKSKLKSGEVAYLLGSYSISAKKSGYDQQSVFLTVAARDTIKNFTIDLKGKADNLYNGWNGQARDVEKAMKEYTKLANKGDDIAQYKLGVCYQQEQKDLVLAQSYWRKAASQGNMEAIRSLAKTTSSRSEKIGFNQQLADAGDREAQYELAMDLYRNGGHSNLSLAQYWMEKSYQKQYVQAVKGMGLISQKMGLLDSALSYYNESLEYDTTTSSLITSLGSDYQNQGNLEKAKLCFETGVKHKVPNVSNLLTDLGERFFAEGANHNIDLSESCFAQASSLGNDAAKERMADFDYYGYGKHPVNVNKAMETYISLPNKSNDLKLRIARYYLEERRDTISASGYFEGISGVVSYPDNIGDIFYKIGEYFYSRKTYATACNFLEKAAKQHVSSTRLYSHLGYIYYEGRGGIEKNPDKAFTNFNNGYKLGDGQCARMVGICYEKGTGVTMDKKLAVDRYLEAIDRGDLTSYAYLGTLMYQIQEKELALKYWREGASQGNKRAVNNLITYLKSRKDDASKAELEQWIEVRDSLGD